MSATATGAAALFGLDPATYRPHALHDGARAYPETNCYADILIELLHARGDEPLAALGSAVRLDFEGDQWTFFKPRPEELELLYGIDIHEMQPYRPLPEQIELQLRAGRTIIVELDAWYLPDTAGTSYRAEHVKTSVAVEAIDVDGERLRYFHNTSLHELGREDFRGVFRAAGADAAILPPYTELVRFDAGPRLAGADLRAAAGRLLREHLGRRPAANPFVAHGEQLQSALPRLAAGEAVEYHVYAFATVRMAGAGFELLADHVDWLLEERGAEASAALRRIVELTKLLNFKLARRRAFDPGPTVAELAAAWDAAMGALDRAAG